MSIGTGIIDLIETAYRELDAPDDAWLRALRQHALPLFPDATWVTAAHVELAPGGFVTHTLAADQERAALHESWHHAARRELLEAIYLRGPVSRLAPLIAGTEWVTELRAAGVKDVVCAVGLDPSGRGVVLSYGTQAPSLPPRRRWLLGRLAAHLASANRLRTRAARSDAVLDPKGRLLDANDGAHRARAALGDAARRIDRARLRGASDEERVGLWNALVEGRWSLVERHDTDGRRMFVARRNPPTSAPHRTLDEHERVVASLVALGRPLKVVGYELGRSESWVSRTLRRALAKLGLDGYTALVELHGALVSA